MLRNNQVAVKNNVGQTIIATVKYVGEKSTRDFDSVQHNRVSVRNADTKKRCSFDYWGSRMNPNQESHDGAVNALYCMFMDATSSSGVSFEDFCLEMGYDTDSRNAEKIYKGCQKMEEKFENVVGDIWDNSDTFNHLGEVGLEELVSDGTVITE